MPTSGSAAFSRSATALADRLSAIESEIYQVKNQSSQDPLNYPIRLNNKIAALAGVVGGTESKPTSQSYTVFNDLSAQLDRQLSAITGALVVLPSLNSTLKAAGLAPIVPSTTEVKPAPGTGASAESGGDEVER
jgi:hypothetical protein